VFLLGARQARRGGVGRPEQRLFARVNGAPRRWYAPVWSVMQFGSLAGAVATAAGASSIGRRNEARRIAAAGIGAWVAAKGVKHLVGRGRTASVFSDARVLGRQQSGLGYPSGHAAVSAAMVMVIRRELPGPFQPLVWLLPVVVSASRMYVGAHLPLDVAGGAALGIVCGGVADLAITDRA
jgi:undecaprenyl-diphosphatase